MMQWCLTEQEGYHWSYSSRYSKGLLECESSQLVKHMTVLTPALQYEAIYSSAKCRPQAAGSYAHTLETQDQNLTDLLTAEPEDQWAGGVSWAVQFLSNAMQTILLIIFVWKK